MITKITCRYSFEVLDFHCNDFGFTFNIGVSYLGIYKTSMYIAAYNAGISSMHLSEVSSILGTPLETSAKTVDQLIFFYAFFVQGRRQPAQSQLIQIYSVDWTDVYDSHTTLNTEQNQLAIKVSADN